MTELVLGGSATSALWHMCGYGLAAVLEDAGDTTVRLWWEDGNPLRFKVLTSMTPEAIGECVVAHAQRACEPDHWVQAKIADGPREGISLFSPRVAAARSSAEWAEYLAQRASYLDRTVRELDQVMLSGLGVPAHWRHDAKESDPDAGASRWEMKTRNRGEEFVGQRLAPLAVVVAQRSPESIVSALLGASLVDELARGSSNSRTPTGLSIPRPTDSAVAWLALWGMAWLPVAHRIGRLSATPGAHPSTRRHPDVMVLPLIAQPQTSQRWQVVLRSAYLLDSLYGDDDVSTVAKTWLVGRQVAGLACFPIRVGGSASAPERMLLDARIEPLQ